MKLDSVRGILEALDATGVRFLIAGGLAVNAHGYHRFTKDVDLVVQLTEENVTALFTALGPLGYRPSVPISREQFGDPDLRERMLREKGMQVLQFWSDDHRETPIDVFVREPFDFETEYERAVSKEFAGVGLVRVVSIPTLIEMKEQVGRPQDLLDVDHLRLRLEDR